MLIGFVRCHLSTDSCSGFQNMLFSKECEVFLWGKQACPSCLTQNCSLRNFDFPEPLHVQIILQLYIYMYVCLYTLEVRGQRSVISLITFHLYFEIRSLSLATLALSSTAPLVSTSHLTPGEDFQMHAAMSSFHRTQHNCVCECVQCVTRGQKRVSHPLELELQV